MDVILLEKVQNLGNLGDKVSVRSGYGRNYLIPQGKAASATSVNLAKFEARRAELEKAAAENLAAAQVREQTLRALGSVTIMSKAGDEGKLFGSVGTVDISEALAKTGVKVEKQDIRMPHGPLRTLGEHEVAIHLHTDINVSVKIIVTPEV
ncbi:MAG: 50S ribosomal protein L9 [Gammaproteobacteria bacterium]